MSMGYELGIPLALVAESGFNISQGKIPVIGSLFGIGPSGLDGRACVDECSGRGVVLFRETGGNCPKGTMLAEDFPKARNWPAVHYVGKVHEVYGGEMATLAGEGGTFKGLNTRGVVDLMTKLITLVNKTCARMDKGAAIAVLNEYKRIWSGSGSDRDKRRQSAQVKSRFNKGGTVPNAAALDPTPPRLDFNLPAAKLSSSFKAAPASTFATSGSGAGGTNNILLYVAIAGVILYARGKRRV